MSDLKQLASALGDDVVNEVKTTLGADYDSLTDEQKDAIKRTGAKLMELQLRARSGEDVTEKLQAVESTVQDWKVWGAISASEAFYAGVQKVAKTLGTFLGGFAAEAAGRLVPGL